MTSKAQGELSRYILALNKKNSLNEIRPLNTNLERNVKIARHAVHKVDRFIGAFKFKLDRHDNLIRVIST